MIKKNCRLLSLTCILTFLLLLLIGCSPSSATPTITPTATENVAGLSDEAIITLRSLEKVDKHPLFVMHYAGGYDQYRQTSLIEKNIDQSWACSLFASLGDPDQMLYGRNFDWGGVPALLLFTDPPDGYASVSMVNIDYTTLDVTAARHPTELPLKDRQFLLFAPLVPIDGMNEYGLTVAMAAVTSSTAGSDPNKPTIGSLAIIREILDHARTVDDAIAIMRGYNIDFTGGPSIHYLIADRNGEAVLVEYYQGEMVTFTNEDPWHIATNYLRCLAGDGGCSRFNTISERLIETGGKLDPTNAMELLSAVSQPHTDWSIVYGMTSGEVNIVMGTHYETIHNYHLDLANH
jgi:hypothetical protein